MTRLLLLALVALALAPGTWIRSPRPAQVLDAGLVSVAIPVQQPRVGALEIEAMWKLSSEHSLFGGYSALVALDGRTLLTASDQGAALRIRLRDGRPGSGIMTRFGGASYFGEKSVSDLESLTLDRETGTIWAGYENLNAVIRMESDGTVQAGAQPAQMEDWPVNAGPEAIVRLRDGRFIVIAEGSWRWTPANMDGLLFDSDPAEDAGTDAAPDSATPFEFDAGEGYLPVDMAALPDGRVLILVRSFEWGLPPMFRARLLVADPADIREGEEWPWQEIARFTPPMQTDNFEGIAVWGDDYPVTLWMISDDNTAKFQNTLLLRMRWDGELPD
ncbi:esterase-like activity of phytase family protein [Erythrobacteraceae bacterium WH01K]|nr:esterase-like activity of phytase family protein [Erythrobacteraceae bacterium WH01K]